MRNSLVTCATELSFFFFLIMALIFITVSKESDCQSRTHTETTPQEGGRSREPQMSRL